MNFHYIYLMNISHVVYIKTYHILFIYNISYVVYIKHTCLYKTYCLFNEHTCCLYNEHTTYIHAHSHRPYHVRSIFVVVFVLSGCYILSRSVR